MITSFEVGALFKIIDEASPTLRKILAQVRELNKAIEGARANMTAVGKNPALVAAIDETKTLAVAWRDVQKAASAASRAIGAASKRSLAGPTAAGVAEAQQLATAWERIAVATAAANGSARGTIGASRRAISGGAAAAAGGSVGGGGGGNRFRPRAAGHGSGGAHISGPAIGIPGGGHVRFGGNAGGAALGAAGFVGYGAYEAAQMEDAVWQLIYHSGREQTPENRAMFRKILQDSMAESGYSLHDVSESAKQEIRMFQGTPGGGIDVLPEMLRAATIESRLKGESPEESMKALIGLAHMTKQYDPEAIKKLAPAFAFLSTANPGSLSSIERAAGYAVPILQSSLGVDPMQSLLLGTALTRAGATSTKSGTWLREMAIRAMPGTAIFESEKKAEHHDELLKRLGLLDDKEKPLWFTDGKPDIFKLLDIAGTNLDKIPMAERAGVERKLFGAQGSGGLALLADPAVREQITALRREMDSPEFKNRYAGFTQAYEQGSTVQQARTAMAEFNITMMDIGAHTLPAVNSALRDFKGVLEGLRNIIPGAKPGAGGASVGARALEGAAAGAAGGAIYGAFGGPVGALGGAAIGGALGTAYSFMENYTPQLHADMEAAKERRKRQAAKYNWWGKYIGDSDSGEAAPDKSKSSGTFPAIPNQQQSQRPVQLNLNIDGKTLAQALSESNNQYLGFPTQAPAADGMSQFYGGDHNYPDK